jgi:hypothetical protein
MSEALKFHSRELYASLADCEGWRELVMPTFVDNLSRIETRILTDHERLDDRTLRALLSEQTALRRLLETLKQNARSLRPLSPGANMADAIALHTTSHLPNPPRRHHPGDKRTACHRHGV